jgi:hypothetical protein
MPVLSSSWQPTTQKAIKTQGTTTLPARAMTADDKYFQRKAREARTDNPLDPNQDSVDARSAAMEKAAQETRAPKLDDVKGYVYKATVRNDSGKTAKIVFWEYRFVEVAKPANVGRRQFLCAVDLKNGDKKELSVFSTLAPSETIDTESLARSPSDLFQEKAIVNRIEFSDGKVLQRGGWKYEDVQKAVERATSTPWGNETCRSL